MTEDEYIIYARIKTLIPNLLRTALHHRQFRTSIGRDTRRARFAKVKHRAIWKSPFFYNVRSVLLKSFRRVFI